MDTRPNFIPTAAWSWLRGEVVDLSAFPHAPEFAGRLCRVDIRPSWEAWSKMIHGAQAWHLLCDFLAFLPWTYAPTHIGAPKTITAELRVISEHLAEARLSFERLRELADDAGLAFPLTTEDLDHLHRIEAACELDDAAPLAPWLDYLARNQTSKVAPFVEHFDSRWLLYPVADPELQMLRFSHEDVARIATEALSLLGVIDEADGERVEPDAVRNARRRHPTPSDPHDPDRGVFTF